MTRLMSVGTTPNRPMKSARIPTALLTGGGGNDQNDNPNDDDHQRGQTKRDAMLRDDDSASEQPVEKMAKRDGMSTPPPTAVQQSAASALRPPPVDANFQQNQSMPPSSPITVQQSRSSSSVDVEHQPIQSNAPTKEVKKNVEKSESPPEIDRLMNENAELRRLKEKLAQKNSDLNEELQRTTRKGKESLSKESDLNALLMEQLEEGAQRRNRELSVENSLVDALNEIKRKDQMIEYLQAELELSKQRTDSVKRANSSIEKRFNEMRKKVKAMEKSNDAASDLQESLDAVTQEFAELKEEVEKEKRMESRKTCRELGGLFQANVVLEKKLAETNKKNELITGGMMQLLAQCGVPAEQQLQQLSMQQQLQQWQQQQLLQQPPWSSPRVNVPRGTYMERSSRITEVITLEDEDEATTSSGRGRRSGPSQEQPRRSGRTRKPLAFLTDED